MKKSLVALSCLVLSANTLMAQDTRFPGDIPYNQKGEVSGFVLTDPITKSEKAELKAEEIKLFKPRHDFQNAIMKAADYGWRKYKWDITKKEDAIKFALYMQKYVYQGFFKGEKNDDHFDAWANKDRYWCHTPWLNAGVKGREAVHGLTREFPIEHSEAYPSYVTELRFWDRPVSWGGAYFNAAACQAYSKIFGNTETGELKQPKWELGDHPDGTVSFKILFNSAEDKKGNLLIPEVKDAFQWKTRTGKYFSKRERRKLRNLYHIQMDISFKDSKIKGTNPDLKHWGMIGFYYDKDYKGPSEFFDYPVESSYDIEGLPEGLKKMRPVGVQFGLGPGETIVFEGAKNNHRLSEQEAKIYTHEETRLNGPADNPVSSCMSCHAAAGTTVKIPPGVMSNEQYVKEVLTVEDNLDFNMQLDLAKKYYEEAMQKVSELEEEK